MRKKVNVTFESEFLGQCTYHNIDRVSAGEAYVTLERGNLAVLIVPKDRVTCIEIEVDND